MKEEVEAVESKSLGDDNTDDILTDAQLDEIMDRSPQAYAKSIENNADSRFDLVDHSSKNINDAIMASSDTA
jgi:hypothetical protein